MLSSTHTPIDLTNEDDDPDRTPTGKRLRTESGAVSLPPSSYPPPYQPQYASPSSSYGPQSPWSPPFDPQAYYRQNYATSPPLPQPPQQSYFPEGQYPSQPAQPTLAHTYSTLPPHVYAKQSQPRPQPSYQASPAHNVIDLTGTPPPGQPPKDVRRDVVCIGQLQATALVLYPIPYICSKNNNGNEDFVPVRLKYDEAAKKRIRTPQEQGEETIHITAPQYKGPSGGSVGGEDFGVVEQRVASVLGPLMAKVLIRLEATVKRNVGNAPILPMRVLVFTPRGNVKVVANYLSVGNILLEHPSVPYNPAEHRDSPPYENPHNPSSEGSVDYRYPATQNRWNTSNVAGKSVEVQRSQVDEVFKSLRNGEDLTETDGGPNVYTNLYPHQKKALTFLLEREKEREMPNKSGWLWQPKKDSAGRIRAWFNPVTGKEVTKEPPEAKGSILADDMGLGKTISVVSLMANTMDSARVFAYGPIQKITLRVAKAAPEPPLTAAHFAGQVWGMPETSGDLDSSMLDDSGGLGKNGKGKGKRETQKELVETARQARIKAKSRATLIVCPLSTIANWEDQFKEHWAGEVFVVGGASGSAPSAAAASEGSGDGRHGAKLKLYVYHGSARKPDTNFLADFDAVITTYSTLGTEFSKQSKSTALYEDDGTEDQAEDSGSDSMSDNEGMIIKLKEKKKPKKRLPGAALAAGLEISSPLQQIHWFRVVLDEAHSIKETSTIASRACCDLMADRRLALTGTPVQNKLDDVFALIKFLRFNPFDDKSVWSEYIGGPAKFGQPLGVARLQTIMKSITLRRTKESTDASGKRILNLPPRYDEVRYLKFDETEKVVYDSYYTESKAEFSQLRKKGEVMKNYVGILQKILRLRQICDHYELVKGKDEGPTGAEVGMDYNEILSAISREGLTIVSATAIFSLLREGGTAQCSECGQDLATQGAGGVLDGAEVETPAPNSSKRPRKGTKAGSRGPTRSSSPTAYRPVITKCQHIYCIECFRLSISPNWPKGKTEGTRACSVCQAEISPMTDAIEVSPDGMIPNDLAPKMRPPKKEKRQKGSGLQGYNASTKVKALMSDLMQTSQTNPNSENYNPNVANEIRMVDGNGHDIDDGLTKTVVFSQWTSMLDKIEDALEDANIKYDRLDGTMKREERARAMDALKHDPKTEVLLVSLRAGGVGLNLTAARRVYLMDPYWNPAVENQAVDRIHRLGQTHPVKTIKMIMEDSIETRLLEVQARKTQLANMTLGQPLSKAEITQRRLEELNDLFAK